jgi:hypothetical protein
MRPSLARHWRPTPESSWDAQTPQDWPQLRLSSSSMSLQLLICKLPDLSGRWNSSRNLSFDLNLYPYYPMLVLMSFQNFKCKCCKFLLLLDNEWSYNRNVVNFNRMSLVNLVFEFLIPIKSQNHRIEKDNEKIVNKKMLPGLQWNLYYCKVVSYILEDTKRKSFLRDSTMCWVSR